jgi:hypothetical protein
METDLMEEAPNRPARELAIGSAGGALAVFFSLAIPDPSASLLVGGALAPYTTELVRHVAVEWRRKRVVVEDAAVAAAAVAPEEFCEILSEHPALIALAQKIAWAASMSASEPKLRGLGALLGGAVAMRGDRLDETQLLAAALSDMEGPHALVLEVLTQPPPDSEERRRWAAGTPAEAQLFPSRAQDQAVSLEARQVAWTPEQIAAELPIDAALVLPCLGVLTFHGLAESVPALDGTQRFFVNNLGRALAEVMKATAKREIS